MLGQILKIIITLGEMPIKIILDGAMLIKILVAGEIPTTMDGEIKIIIVDGVTPIKITIMDGAIPIQIIIVAGAIPIIIMVGGIIIMVGVIITHKITQMVGETITMDLEIIIKVLLTKQL